MKKVIMSIGLSLVFGLAFANNSLTESVVPYQVEMSPDGLCTVYIYVDGILVYTNTSEQPSAAACADWAAGEFWSFILHPGTGLD
ncbi:MAG: hypothetical protein RBT46_03295 [Weeksellaceae bacterium]|jgi:hypothetical protein|nr:hypothetical protein [Weeksellaceae bacterium]